MSSSFSKIAGIGTVASIAGAMSNSPSAPQSPVGKLDMAMGKAQRQHTRERTQGSGVLGKRVGMSNRATAPVPSEGQMNGVLGKGQAGVLGGGISNVISKVV